jgi:hypothetical protein
MKNMKIIESKMLQIYKGNVIEEENKDFDHPEEEKEEGGSNLLNSEKYAIKNKEPVAIEYFAINLM